MARTPAQAKSLETKALAAESKSEGMRSLFDAGYTAAEIKEVFGAPYGFVYGVGVRHGAITSTPRAAKPAKAAAAAKAAPRKAAARPTAKAKTAAKAKAKSKA